MEFEGLAAALRNDLVGREEGAISGLKMLENLRFYFAGRGCIAYKEISFIGLFLYISFYIWHYTLFLFYFSPLPLPLLLSL